MNAVVSSVVRNQNTISYRGKCNSESLQKMITLKAHNSIDEYYEKELKDIQASRQDRRLAELLDPRAAFERIKNKILINSDK